MHRLRAHRVLKVVEQAEAQHQIVRADGRPRAGRHPLAGRADLVVVLETFTSGFSNEALASAEDMVGPTV